MLKFNFFKDADNSTLLKAENSTGFLQKKRKFLEQFKSR